MRRRLTRMLLLAVAGAVLHRIRGRYQETRAGGQAMSADSTPFDGRAKGDTVTYESTAPEEAKPHTTLGL